MAKTLDEDLQETAQWSRRLQRLLYCSTSIVILLSLIGLYVLYQWPHHYAPLRAVKEDATTMWQNNCWDSEKQIPRYWRKDVLDCDRNKGLMSMNVPLTALGNILKEMSHRVLHHFSKQIQRVSHSIPAFILFKFSSDVLSFAFLAGAGIIFAVYMVLRSKDTQLASMQEFLVKQQQFVQTNATRQRKRLNAVVEGRKNEAETEHDDTIIVEM